MYSTGKLAFFALASCAAFVRVAADPLHCGTPLHLQCCQEVTSPSDEKVQQLANSLGIVIPAASDEKVGINCHSITVLNAGDCRTNLACCKRIVLGGVLALECST